MMMMMMMMARLYGMTGLTLDCCGKFTSPIEILGSKLKAERINWPA